MFMLLKTCLLWSVTLKQTLSGADRQPCRHLWSESITSRGDTEIKSKGRKQCDLKYTKQCNATWKHQIKWYWYNLWSILTCWHEAGAFPIALIHFIEWQFFSKPLRVTLNSYKWRVCTSFHIQASIRHRWMRVLSEGDIRVQSSSLCASDTSHKSATCRFLQKKLNKIIRTSLWFVEKCVGFILPGRKEHHRFRRANLASIKHRKHLKRLEITGNGLTLYGLRWTFNFVEEM